MLHTKTEAQQDANDASDHPPIYSENAHQEQAPDRPPPDPSITGRFGKDDETATVASSNDTADRTMIIQANGVMLVDVPRRDHELEFNVYSKCLPGLC